MIAFVFPGQGAQKVGMGHDLANKYPLAAQTFAEVDAALGEPLCELCFHGPEEALRQTRNTQPAIVGTSVAAYRLVSQVVSPSFVAGHSLGEYTALVAAGSLSLTDAVRVVRKRGLLMEAAVPKGTGTMAAIIGLDANQVEDICQVASECGMVAPATYNGGGQIVVAGEVAAVNTAIELALKAGARRVQHLNVSGPFHTKLMRCAAEQLQQILLDIHLANATIPVYANASATALYKPDDIRKALVSQVYSPVRWEECVHAMWSDGARIFIEIGPGRVLSGLIKRIIPEAQVFNVSDAMGLENIIVHLKGGGVK